MPYRCIVLWFSLWVNDNQRNISLYVVLNCSNIFNKICLFNLAEQIVSNIPVFTKCKIKIYNLVSTLRVIFILDNEHTNANYNKYETDK